jgi:hypothetical protein
MPADTKAFGRGARRSVVLALLCVTPLHAHAGKIPDGAVKVREETRGGTIHEYYACPSGTILIGNRCVPVGEVDRVKSIALLREQIRDLQEAFRRLDKSRKTSMTELKEWQQRSIKTSEAAQDRLNNLMLELTLGKLGKMFDNRVKTAATEMRKLKQRLDKAPDAKTREQIRKAMKLLSSKVTNIQTARILVVDQMKRMNGIYSRVQAGKGDATDREKGLKQVYMTVKNLLNDPVVKEAWEACLEHGKKLTVTARFADSYVESAYQITTQLCSLAQINQHTATLEEYLKAVRVLSDRMEKTMGTLKKLERMVEGN